MTFKDFIFEETGAADIAPVDNKLGLRKRNEITESSIKDILRSTGVKIKDYIETKKIYSIEFAKLDSILIKKIEQTLENSNYNNYDFDKKENTLLIFKK